MNLAGRKVCKSGKRFTTVALETARKQLRDAKKRFARISPLKMNMEPGKEACVEESPFGKWTKM